MYLTGFLPVKRPLLRDGSNHGQFSECTSRHSRGDFLSDRQKATDRTLRLGHQIGSAAPTSCTNQKDEYILNRGIPARDEHLMHFVAYAKKERGGRYHGEADKISSTPGPDAAERQGAEDQEVGHDVKVFRSWSNCQSTGARIDDSMIVNVMMAKTPRVQIHRDRTWDELATVGS